MCGWYPLICMAPVQIKVPRMLFGVLYVFMIRVIALHVPSGSYMAHVMHTREKINKE